MDYYISENEFCIEQNDLGIRLDKFLTLNNQGLSRNQIQNLIKKGNLSLNNVIFFNPSYNLKAGDRLKLINTTEKFCQILPKKMELDIVYEDSDLIVLNKQKNLSVHPGNGLHTDNTLVSGLLYHLGNDNLSNLAGITRPGIVHRLDKDTSGLMLIAKNNLSHQNLAKQIYEKKVKREYKALVWGNISERSSQQILYPISRHKIHRDKMEVNPKLGKYALTNYEIIDIFSHLNISLIKCKLDTGRTHQIRVHMEYIKHPLIGDQKYFKNKKHYFNRLEYTIKNLISNIKSQMLHSYQIEFEHPMSKKYITLKKDTPKEFQNIVKILSSINNNVDSL